jgi:hypothetical protein
MRMIASGPVIPVFDRPLIDGRSMWLLCSFQGPWRGLYAGLRWACAEAIFLSPLRLTPGGRRSLKAQQHAGGLNAASPRAPE